MNAAVASLNETELVDQAAGWAGQIVSFYQRWHGENVKSATYRAARKHHIPEKVFLALRHEYRRPKEIGAGAYMKLMLAAEHVRSIRERLEQELRDAEADGLNAANSAAYRVAIAALGKDPREVAA